MSPDAESPGQEGDKLRVGRGEREGHPDRAGPRADGCAGLGLRMETQARGRDSGVLGTYSHPMGGLTQTV